LIRLDVDRISPLFLLKLLHNLKPCWVRLSPSKKGLHVKKEGLADYESWAYLQFDDPRRRDLNVWREARGMSHNVLWSVKNNNVAGDWVLISVSGDVNCFFDSLFVY